MILAEELGINSQFISNLYQGMESGQKSQWPRATGKGYPKPGGAELVVPNPKLKLLDQVREIMRLKRYSLRTERCYCDWIRRYIHFHHLKSRDELMVEATAKVELFLSDLAVKGQVAGSTQNQAFNALVFGIAAGCQP